MQTGERIKTVFDTGIVLQATLHPNGPAGQALRLVSAGTVVAFMSTRMREEHADVLSRPNIRAKNPYLTDERARVALEWLDAHLFSIDYPTRYVEYPRDPNDEAVLNLAIYVQADYLVARDKDLLDLMHNRDFRLLYPFLRIVDPVTFLQELAPSAREDEAEE